MTSSPTFPRAEDRHRGLEAQILDDLKVKMVFISGPRQTGKTTLAKRLLTSQGRDLATSYFTWDSSSDRRQLMAERLPEKPGMVVFDEIHKYTRWRQLVKGFFDKSGKLYPILVTGSARLDLYRRGGDSLQGRYHHHRLHPFTVAEVGGPAEKALKSLMTLGGFPEPFLSQSETRARRWSRDYASRLIREDLASIERVSELALLERLVDRLPDLVGSPLSLNALREDLQVSQPTVARWMDILERLFAFFRLSPFGSPKIRAVKKEQKHYHYDWTVVKDPGLRFENLVAAHLLKWCHWREDSHGENVELRYFRDTDKREVDFVLMKDKKPTHFIECKLSDPKTTLPMKYLHERFPEVPCTQVVYQMEGARAHRTAGGIAVVAAAGFLAGLA